MLLYNIENKTVVSLICEFKCKLRSKLRCLPAYHVFITSIDRNTMVTRLFKKNRLFFFLLNISKILLDILRVAALKISIYHLIGNL